MIPVSVLGNAHCFSVLEVGTRKQEDSRDDRHRALLSEGSREVVPREVMPRDVLPIHLFCEIHFG